MDGILFLYGFSFDFLKKVFMLIVVSGRSHIGRLDGKTNLGLGGGGGSVIPTLWWRCSLCLCSHLKCLSSLLIYATQ